jgi:hypothetical protein
LDGSARRPVVTDAQGRFVLSDVRAGPVGLRAAAAGDVDGRHLEVVVPHGWYEEADGGHGPYDLPVE